jgi:hypothetical protein
MAVEVIHRRGAEAKPHSLEFGSVAAAIDNLERSGWNRIGGLTDEESRELARLERRLYRLRPGTAADWQWLARRLARALENGWHGNPVKPLLKLAARARSFAGSVSSNGGRCGSAHRFRLGGCYAQGLDGACGARGRLFERATECIHPLSKLALRSAPRPRGNVRLQRLSWRIQSGQL